MSSSIICSAKTLTLAIAPFLFTLVVILCEFAMMPGVKILLLPQEEEVYTLFFLREQMYLCLTSNGYAKVIDELE